MSPATTSPLSSTRSRTSTRPVDRPCPSVSGVGIGSVFYGLLERSRCRMLGEGQAYLATAMPADLGGIWYGTSRPLHRSPTIAPSRDVQNCLQAINRSRGRVDRSDPPGQAPSRETPRTRIRIAPGTSACRRRARRPPIDRANRRRAASPPRRRRRRDARCRSPAGSGFRGNGPSPPTTASSREKPREIEARRESRRVGRERLVRQHGERARARQRLEHVGHARIRTRVLQQARVVDREKAIERVGGRSIPAAANARATSVAAPSPTMRPIAPRAAARAARFEQRVRRVGDVAAGIDERAVEVEDDETKGSALNVQDRD